MSDPTVQDSKVQKASADEMKVALVEVLQENHRLEAKLGIMREQHALVAELLNTQLPAVDAEGDPKGETLAKGEKEASYQH
ncbi:g6028 [Coccomyxa viridis]|uniref:G6028 protein n=1 Tax=Coccomyxa viridis TaxID=1274662 RepID=A0ABP1G139_9CHLO